MGLNTCSLKIPRGSLGILLLLLLVIVNSRVVFSQQSAEDSLQSALNAVNRRQRDLSSSSSRYGDDGDYGYPLEGPDDLTFLTERDAYTDYMDDDSTSSKRNSPFRERAVEEEGRDRERQQLAELAQSYLQQRDNNDYLNNNNENKYYDKILRELWDKYQSYQTNRQGAQRRVPEDYNLNYNTYRKRYYYSGDSSSGLRKRNRYNEPESMDDYYYGNTDRAYDDDDYWHKQRYNRDRKSRQKPYSFNNKRFPVSKRSSPPQYDGSDIIHEHKRSTTKKELKTDPKVAKDLSNVFGSATTTTTTQKPAQKETKPPKKAHDQSPKPIHKTTVSPISKIDNNKPILIKKKSIDWSDYFGLDRRKKSDNLDNEWLLDRYHNKIKYPLQSFKNHDQPIKKESSTEHKPELDEAKIAQIDAKLKKMEDTIIDDALKYTGAHEGAVDSHEIQEVKDRIISRLTAAYNLEKMRLALGEYKLVMNKENQKMKADNENDNKRAKKQDEIEDNNIKCAQGDDGCDPYHPYDAFEQIPFDECPKIQRACNEVVADLGHEAKVFESACNMHQLCLLCSNNSWFAPTRQCNVLFLTKAFEFCDGNEECQKKAQKSVRYLVDVYRSLRLEPGECELTCPDRR